MGTTWVDDLLEANFVPATSSRRLIEIADEIGSPR